MKCRTIESSYYRPAGSGLEAAGEEKGVLKVS